jgi:phytoene/squalene synthetase
VRDPAISLYAFCRMADDAIDISLFERLERQQARQPGL